MGIVIEGQKFRGGRTLDRILFRPLILQEIELTETQNYLPKFLKPEKRRARKKLKCFQLVSFLEVFVFIHHLAFPRGVRDRLKNLFFHSFVGQKSQIKVSGGPRSHQRPLGRIPCLFQLPVLAAILGVLGLW